MNHNLFLSIDRVLYPGISENGTLAVTPQKRENCVDRAIRNSHLPMRLLSCLIKLLYQVSKIEIYTKQRNLVFMFGRCVSVCAKRWLIYTQRKLGFSPKQKKTQRMGWGGPDMQVATSMVLVKVVVDCISTLREKVRIAPVKEIA